MTTRKIDTEMEEYQKKWNEELETISRDMFVSDRQKVVLLRWMSSKASLIAAEIGFEISEEGDS